MQYPEDQREEFLTQKAVIESVFNVLEYSVAAAAIARVIAGPFRFFDDSHWRNVAAIFIACFLWAIITIYASRSLFQPYFAYRELVQKPIGRIGIASAFLIFFLLMVSQLWLVHEAEAVLFCVNMQPYLSLSAQLGIL